MERRFVIEAILIAAYGHLMQPSRPVEYIIPYSTLMELYEMLDSKEPVMQQIEDDAHVRQKMAELIAFFEEPFNKKKVERALQAPWRKSPPLPVSDVVTFTIVNAADNAQYGELFDPIETELILAAFNEKVPLMTDQFEMLDKIIDNEVPIEAYDVEDFEFAIEDGLSVEAWSDEGRRPWNN